MSSVFVAERLNVQAFARGGAVLEGHEPLSRYERLCADAAQAVNDRVVQWRAQGEVRLDAAGEEQIWLHLKAQAGLPLICQRCLAPVDMELSVERSFRFVATEAQAEAQDEEAEEDVLALSRDFNLRDLIEDELLMALPLVPRHVACPIEPRLSAQDHDFEQSSAQQPHPFAALAGLKGGRQRDKG